MTVDRAQIEGPFQVWVHADAIDEASACDWAIEQAAQELVDAFRRGLHRTAGTKLRPLSRLDSRCEYRLRRHTIRAICSQTVDATDRPVLFIHAVRRRSVVYRENRFDARLEAFYAHGWDAEERGPLDWLEEHYHSIRVTPLGETSEAADDVLQVPLLTDKQFACLDVLIPFPKEFGAANAFLLIGHGPPGCGKTLVAQEAAIAAYEQCGYDVLVLAPTDDILGRVKAYAAEHGLSTVAFEGDSPEPGDEPAFRVGEVRDFFGHIAGTTKAPITRETELYRWWRQMQESPRLAAWFNRHPLAKTPVFVRLMDALWTERREDWTRGKDAMSVQYADHLECLSQLLADQRALDVIEDARKGGDIRFRCEIARSAEARIEEVLRRGETSSRPLLVLVDEAQDLVPAEWQALISWCHARLAEGAPTRIALLGDENQRLTPTAFSWDGVRAYVRDGLHVPEERIREEVIEHRSFRLPSSLARSARLVFNNQLLEVRGGRQGVYATDDTESGRSGRVEFHVVEHAVSASLAAARQIAGRLEGEQRLTVVVPEDAEAATGPGGRLDVFRPRRVKGMEFERVVVVSPFASTVKRGATQLAYDEATTAYTVLTRSSRDLLCVLTPEEWEILTPVADDLADAGAVLRRHEVELGHTEVVHALRDLVASFSEEVSRDARIARLERVISAAAEDLLGVEESSDAARAIVDEVLLQAHELLRLHSPERIELVGARILVTYPWLDSQLRDRARIAADEGKTEVTVISLLLLGETAAAAECCADARDGDGDGLLAQLQAPIFRGMDAAQARLYGEREMARVAPWSPSSELARTVFLGHVAEALLDFDIEEG